MKGNTEATYETIKKIRNDWGNVKPYTKVELSKKKQKKEKHKKDWSRDYEVMDWSYASHYSAKWMDGGKVMEKIREWETL